MRWATASAIVLGAPLVPAAAQADPVSSEDCTVQLTGTDGEDSATFTITCDEQTINGAQFTTSADALFPGFQTEEPGQGLTCVPPAGTEFNCGGHVETGVVATAEVGTRDPCGTGFIGEGLALDTGEGEPPTPDERDVEFAAVEIQSGDDPGDGDGAGGGGDDGDDEDDGDPEGGVDAGFGGAAHPATSGDAGPALPLANGRGLILLGLVGGAVSLARP